MCKKICSKNIVKKKLEIVLGPGVEIDENDDEEEDDTEGGQGNSEGLVLVLLEILFALFFLACVFLGFSLELSHCGDGLLQN